MKISSIIIIIISLSVSSLKAQNSDLLFKYFSGGYISMGGTGIAANNDISSFDINPAVLTNFSSVNISLAANFKYYSYSLLRISSQVGGTNWDWNNSKLAVQEASIVYPINHSLTFGLGLFQKLDPHFVNKKRALTFSDLFSQETKGNIYSLVLSTGIKLNEIISLGVSAYYYLGNINSRVIGDNHGNDLDKWVFLESRLSGVNFRSGILIKNEDWSAGIVIETPCKMKVSTTNELSSNAYFEFLLPDYEQTYLIMPWIFGAGFSFNGYNNWLIEIDIETRQYKESNVRFNLYEFGGLPVWEDANIFRVGIQYFDENKLNIPIRAGYSYIPQLYYSNNSVGIGNAISSYTNTNRNVKHVFTLGTKLTVYLLTINFNLEYSIIKWNRSLLVLFTITDEYYENNFTLSTQFTLTL